MSKTTKITNGPVAPAQQTQALANIDWSGMGVTGLERVSSEDLGIPFLIVLQKGSPQVDTSSPEYPTKGIAGAQAGDILHSISNTIVKKLKDPPIPFIPCGYERCFVEWKPRGAGGGLVRVHRTPEILHGAVRNEKNQDVIPNGNIIVTTAYFYGILLLEEPIKVMVSMTSTQLKVARTWLNQMTALKVEGPNGKFTPPMFSQRYGLSTVPQSNEKGSWFGWKVELIGPVQTKEMVEDLRDFAKKIVSGQANPALPLVTGDDNVM